jgi:hypothetical protein
MAVFVFCILYFLLIDKMAVVVVVGPVGSVVNTLQTSC